MNCRECRNLIVAGLYGTRTAPENDALEAHVRDCADCAAFLRQAPDARWEPFPPADDVPVPDWEKAWRAVASKSVGRKKRPFLLRPRPAWAYAASALLVVFLLGYVAGRRFLVKGPDGMKPTALVAASGSPLQRLAESVEPLLVSFVNRTGSPSPTEASRLERQIVRDMLGQTRLLKGLAAEQGDPFLKDVVDDLEFILVGIANMDPGDRQSSDRMVRWIKDRDIKAKLRMIAGPSSVI